MPRAAPAPAVAVARVHRFAAPLRRPVVAVSATSARLDAAIHPRVTRVSAFPSGTAALDWPRRPTRLRARVTPQSHLVAATPSTPTRSPQTRLAWSPGRARLARQIYTTLTLLMHPTRTPARRRVPAVQHSRPVPLSARLRFARRKPIEPQTRVSTRRVKDLPSTQQTWQQKVKTSTSTRSLTASSRVRHRPSPQFLWARFPPRISRSRVASTPTPTLDTALRESAGSLNPPYARISRRSRSRSGDQQPLPSSSPRDKSGSGYPAGWRAASFLAGWSVSLHRFAVGREERGSPGRARPEQPFAPAFGG